jgi:hypothetical protein
MVFQHSATGTGRNHNRVIKRKGFELLAGDFSSFFGESGVVGRLPTAGLLLRKEDFNPFALNQLDSGHSRLGKTEIN